MLEKMWVYGFAYWFIFMDWLQDQFDNNDYFVGGLVVLNIMLALKWAGWW